uniref:Eclosion hormone 2 n=2 Tax=Zophobas TaxID=7073 RepID=A0A977SQR5_ZOPAT|nr:eclosion hormone 2 [Zophobas atratus]
MGSPTFIIVLVLMGIIENYICAASIPVCITNCVQCKQMFGPYFQGRACGDACISSNGQLMPDCNNPRTLGNFLKRLY